MDDSSSRYDWLAGWAAAVVVGFFGVLLAGFYVPAYNGTDENGYMCSARRIALTGNSAKYTAHPLEFVSHNVVQVEAGIFYAKYPLGYPWLCAAAYRLGGPAAAFLVSPILAALALVGMFLLARSLVGAFAAVLATVLLATNPLHALFGLTALSHAAAVCFAVWAMFFLWRWTERGGWVNAALAGGLAAYTYTVRYSEALLALPVLAMVVWRYVSLPEGATPTERTAQVRQWRREVLAMLAGVVVCAGPLWIHHWLAFGAPWKNGYDLCGESTGFGWKWFQENWWTMLTRLNSPGLLLIFPLGLIGLAYVAVHEPKRGTLLGLWVLPSVLIYTAYYWAPTGEGRGYVRFFVSVFPAFIVCALALLAGLVKPRPFWAVAVGGYVAITATFNLREAFPGMADLAQQLATTERTWDVVRARVPEHSIIVANDGLLNNLEYAG
ncbi:MAG: glycosyltransferase family 39 protein, partial [Verrucomicrobiota bacterium]